MCFGCPVRCSCSCFSEAGTEDEDEGEELMRRTGDFIGSSDSLPKGIIKVVFPEKTCCRPFTAALLYNNE